MAGKRVEGRVHTLKPLEVVERQSTSVSAVDDADLREALRYIQERAHERLHVEGVAEAVSISRRMLERKFRALLGRSPAEEIKRVQMERAKTLLLRENLSISEVARLSGFGSAGWFSTAFRMQVGESPVSFRRRRGG